MKRLYRKGLIYHMGVTVPSIIPFMVEQRSAMRWYYLGS